MTKTPRMYSPEYGDRHFFKFASGTSELRFITTVNNSLIFYNNETEVNAKPMSKKRFKFLMRNNLVGFKPQIQKATAPPNNGAVEPARYNKDGTTSEAWIDWFLENEVKGVTL